MNRAFGSDAPAHRMNQTSADRKSETGAGGPAVGARDTVEFVEDFAESARWDAHPVVGDRQSDGVALGMAAMRVTDVGGLYLWALSSRFSKTCSKSDASPLISGKTDGTSISSLRLG